jgi:hypothetical protein
LRDFVAVAPLTPQAYVLVAGQRTAVSSLQGPVAAPKAARKVVRFGSTGVGTGIEHPG